MTEVNGGAAFVLRHTRAMTTELVPEISLRLAVEAYDIFQAADEAGAVRPFWAFAWPGGQAIARWLLDNPKEVAGRRVLDIGTGSGLGAIAAMKAGAASAIANDTDALACEAARINAELNGVSLDVRGGDVLGSDLAVDLVLIGEVFYEPEMAMRVSAFIEGARDRGVDLLFADRPGIRRPSIDMELVAEMPAPLTPSLEVADMERARLWRLAPRRNTGDRKRGAGAVTLPEAT